MPLPVFAPPVPPQPGTGRQVAANKTTVRFRDGYEARVQNGVLPPLSEPVTLVWNAITPANQKTITDWLEETGGTGAFLYTLPGETMPRQLVWDSYTQGDAENHDTLSVVLHEVGDIVT